MNKIKKEPSPENQSNCTSLSYRRVKPDGKIVRESKELIELARVLRKNPTKSEKLLWEQLRNRRLKGYRFHRQHIIGGFIVDFYNRALKVAIELDGSVHAREKVKFNDIARQKYLETNDITVLRFKNREVINDCTKILAKILLELESKKKEKETGN